jgi:uncharacterized membrane protein
VRRKLCLAALLVAAFACLCLFPVPSAQAQDVVPVRITENVDESILVTLGGNTRPEAQPKYDRGRVAHDLPLEHVLLLLKRSPDQERELETLIEDLHDSSSPNFHRWLGAQEFGARFGVAQSDRETIEHWLESHGLTVNVDYTNGVLIDFSGTAGQVEEAFHTEIHNLDVKGVKHIANMSDPQVPAALAPAIMGVVSLHDFRPHSSYKSRVNYTVSENGTEHYLVVPGDLATIYNLNPLFSKGISGQGQTIVVIESSDVYSTADWTSFRSVFGLSSYTKGSFTQIHPEPPGGPNNCTDPGPIFGIDTEATIDAEFASATAPSAAIVLASCTDTIASFGGLLALQNLLNQSANPPALVSMSYGVCEASNGAASNAAFNSTFQQAVTEGVSVFVSAGDNAGAFCDKYDSDSMYGIGITGWGSSPHNVAVGATDFGDTYAGSNGTYWRGNNSTTYESAISYIPEIPWDASCASTLLAKFNGFNQTYGTDGFCNSAKGEAHYLTTVGGGGGPSGCATGTPAESGVVGGTCAGWAKPSYQSILGNPHDGVRDIPDVSLFASNGVWLHDYPYCYSGPGGVACTEAPVSWPAAGGTSFASPLMAGIQALVNQKVGARQGNPNFVYYKLAAQQYGDTGDSICNSTLGRNVSGGCIFYDVTQGDNDVNCIKTTAFGAIDCYVPSGSNGVLSTSNDAYQPAFTATTGWDFATGIGTINAYNLVNNWPGSPPSFTLSANPGDVTVVLGSQGTTTISVNQLSGFNKTVALSASGLPTGVTAGFSPNPATTSSTLTFTAAATAATGTVTVTVTGVSGTLTETTTIQLTLTPAPGFSLSSNPSSLSITPGSHGTSAITITPLNGFDASVTFSASGLPTGVTAGFSPNPATGSSTLTLTASASAAIGSSTVTVTGKSGSLTQTTTIQLTVTQAPSFSLSANPGSITLTVGDNGTSAITITPLNGFNSKVTFSASGLPAGVTAGFSPNPATSSSTLTLTASATATTGTVKVTVTGVSGSLSETTTISLTVNPLPNFTLSANPNTLAINQGSQGTSTITISPSNGFKDTVTLSASGLPTGVTAEFSVNPATSSSTLTLAATATATTGTVTVTVQGVSGSLTHTTTITLTVKLQPNFTLSANPTSLAIVQGAAGKSTITITPENGFTASVSLAASGLPKGVTAAFNTNPATLTSVLTLSASDTAATGTSTVTITGTSGSLTHTTTVKLTVNPGLTLMASPSSVSIVQGTSGTSTIIITPENGFVTLSASGLPSGVTAAFSPNPALSNSSLTLTVSASTPQGTYTITIHGSEIGLTATTTLTLTVRPLGAFKLTASPSPLQIAQGSSGSTTISIVPSDGFDQKVTLSAGGLPTGVSASFSPNPTTVSSTLTLKAPKSTPTGLSTITVSGMFESLISELGIGLTIVK